MKDQLDLQKEIAKNNQQKLKELEEDKNIIKTNKAWDEFKENN